MGVSREHQAEARRVRRAVRGDRGARAELLREFQDVWYRFAFRMLGEADAAAEATQETAVRFLKNLPTFRGDATLRTWSLGITRLVCLEHLRKFPRRGACVEVSGSVEGPAAAAEGAEALALLRAAVAGLPTRQREAVVLRYLEQLSVAETAAAMGCAAGTVKSTLSAALASLRRRLGPDAAEPATRGVAR